MSLRDSFSSSVSKYRSSKKTEFPSIKYEPASIHEYDSENTDVEMETGNNFRKKLFPDWLEKQEDFKKLKDAKGNYSVNNIFKLCDIRLNERTEIENGYIYAYLNSRVRYFSEGFSVDTNKHIASKLTSEFYKSGSIIYDKDSVGDEMFIVYNGEVGLYAGGDMIARILYNNVFSEKVRENSTKRNHQAKALTNCELLRLDYDDLRNIITSQGVQAMNKNRELLMASPDLKRWDAIKCDRVCHLFEERKIQKGSFVYDQGSSIDGIFLVKSGKFEVSSVLEIDHFSQYPVAQFSWEIERVTHVIKCCMGFLTQGSIYGLIELLNKSPLRMNRVAAIEDSYILYLSEKNFKELFDDQDISNIIFNSKIKSPQVAINDILESQKWEKTKKSSIISAAKNIEVKPTGSFDFIKRSHDIQKFIDKALDVECSNKKKENNIFSIIKIKKQKKTVGDPNYLEMHKLENISNRRVRFSSSFYNG